MRYLGMLVGFLLLCGQFTGEKVMADNPSLDPCGITLSTHLSFGQSKEHLVEVQQPTDVRFQILSGEQKELAKHVENLVDNIEKVKEVLGAEQHKQLDKASTLLKQQEGKPNGLVQSIKNKNVMLTSGQQHQTSQTLTDKAKLFYTAHGTPLADSKPIQDSIDKQDHFAAVTQNTGWQDQLQISGVQGKLQNVIPVEIAVNRLDEKRIEMTKKLGSPDHNPISLKVVTGDRLMKKGC